MSGEPHPKPMSERRLAAQRSNAAKRIHVRRGKIINCERCGKAIYVRPGEIATRRFCSRTCMGFVQRKPQTCSVCGTSFHAGRWRKTCSKACAREAIRRGKLGSRNPAYTGQPNSNEPRWRAALESCCRLCGSTRLLRRHHVVYEQHVRKRGGDPYDPDDCFTVCNVCHTAHHQAGDKRIPVSKLRPENVAFAVALLGEYARDYFVRYYDLDCEVVGPACPLP